MLEIEIKRDGQVQNIVLDRDEVFIGRRNEKREVHLDLTPDESVSRVHARVWTVQGVVYIEDLGSRAGTCVAGARIEGSIELGPTSEVEIGETCLFFHCPRTENRRGGAPINRASPGAAIQGTAKVHPTESGPSKSHKSVDETMSNSGIYVDMTLMGNVSQSVFDLEEIFIGRKNEDQDIHVDLSGDLKVSRVHARVWRTREICWVEDLKSTHGTLVNGETLNGARVIKPEDIVQIGDVLMQFQFKNEGGARRVKAGEVSNNSSKDQNSENAFEALDSYPVYKEESYRYHPQGHRKKSDLESIFQSRKSPMGRIRSVCEMSLSDPFVKGPDSKDFLDALPDIILRLNGQPDSKTMSEWIVQSVSSWVKGADRASVFAVDKSIGRVKLLAHRPALKPILSDTLTHRAWEEGLAFSWQQVGKEESVRRLSMFAGIYVPMMVLDEEVGMLCIESTTEGASFSSEQLAVMVVIARAMALPLLYRIQRESA